MTTNTTTTTTTATGLPLSPGRWTLDTMHSTISFWVRHLGVSKVRGRFNDFDVTLDVGATAGESRVTATIQTASVDTGNADRDAHLRTPDFLDVERWPTMTFVSTRLVPSGDGWRMEGDLTIAEATRPVVLEVALGGVNELYGSPHAGFGAEISIDRRDFGLEWSLPAGAPSFALGDVAHIELDLQLVAPTAD